MFVIPPAHLVPNNDDATKLLEESPSLCVLSWKKPGALPVPAHSNADDTDGVRDDVATDDDDESVLSSRPRCGTCPCFSSGPTQPVATTRPSRNRNPFHAKQDDG